MQVDLFIQDYGLKTPRNGLLKIMKDKKESF